METELGFECHDAPLAGAVHVLPSIRSGSASLLLSAGVAPSFGYRNTYVNGGQFTNQGIELSLQMTPVQTRSGFTWVSTTTYFRNYSVVNSLPTPSFGTTYGGYPRGRSVRHGDREHGVHSGERAPDPERRGEPRHRHGLRQYVHLQRIPPLRVCRLGSRRQYDRYHGSLLLTSARASTPDSALRAKRLSQLAVGLNPWVQPASYLKVRQLSLSYTLPGHVRCAPSAAVGSPVSVSVNGYNLLHIFNYNGLDPETTTVQRAEYSKCRRGHALPAIAQVCSSASTWDSDMTHTHKSGSPSRGRAELAPAVPVVGAAARS